MNSNTLDRTRDIGKDAETGDNLYFGVDAMGFSLGYFDNDYKAIKDAAEGTDNILNNYFAVTSAVSSQNVNPDFGSAAMGSLYNGNITHMVSAIRKEDESKLDILANNYQYDQLQRIREMKVYATATQSALQTANSFTGATLYRASGGESAYQENYIFDKNEFIVRPTFYLDPMNSKTWHKHYKESKKLPNYRDIKQQYWRARWESKQNMKKYYRERWEQKKMLLLILHNFNLN